LRLDVKMKTVIILSVTALMALSSQAYAGGGRGHYNNKPILSPNISVSLGGVGVLNGNTVAVGNNSSILSGILNGNANGNSLLSGIGITGQNGLLNVLLQPKKKSW